MSSRNSCPTALSPYLRLPPEASLLLFTSTLGCSANWLAAHLMGSVLRPEHKATRTALEADDDGGLGLEVGQEEVGVILVSWLNDQKFWEREMKWIAGIDLSKTSNFSFVDAFTTPPSLSSIKDAVMKSIASLSTTIRHPSRIFLLLDTPSLCLFSSHSPDMTSSHLSTSLLSLRSLAHATALILPTFPSPSAGAEAAVDVRPTPLDVDTAAFLATQAYVARTVMSVRGLDTGAARDVSGVVRVTRGGGYYEGQVGNGEDDVKEGEWLYLVSRDGGVKVFERGSGD